MTSDEIAALKELALKATPGPWRWMENEFREKYMKRMNNGRWRARIGKRAVDSWVFFLSGPLKGGIAPEHADEYDYRQVMALRWEDVKRGRTLINVSPGDADAAFIAACDPGTILALIALTEGKAE